MAGRFMIVRAGPKPFLAFVRCDSARTFVDVRLVAVRVLERACGSCILQGKDIPFLEGSEADVCLSSPPIPEFGYLP